MIRQTTGEDWNDSKISLSTAVPSAGGNVPELNPENARIKPKIIHYAPSKSKGFKARAKRSANKSYMEDQRLAYLLILFLYIFRYSKSTISSWYSF